MAGVPFFICGFLLYGSMIKGQRYGTNLGGQPVRSNINDPTDLFSHVNRSTDHVAFFNLHYIHDNFSLHVSGGDAHPPGSYPVPLWQLAACLVVLIGNHYRHTRVTTSLALSTAHDRSSLGLFWHGVHRSPPGLIVTKTADRLAAALLSLYL